MVNVAKCRRCVLLLMTAFCLTAISCASVALQVSRPVPSTIKDYWHTSFRQQDGAPANVWGIAQTPDGWLWLATPSGLYRFDGVNFESFDLLPPGDPSPRSVATLYVSEKGDLWVVYAAGVVAVWHQGARQGGGQTTGLPPGATVDDIFELPSGPMVVVEAGKYFVLDGNRWVPRETSSIGLTPNPDYEWASFDGQLWAAAPDGIYDWSKEQGRFVPWAKQELPATGLIFSPNGDLWRRTQNEGIFLVRRASSLGLHRFMPMNASNSSFVDSQDTIWTVACGGLDAICRLAGGLERRSPIHKEDMLADTFGPGDGLPPPMTGMEDRDGNIWFGTKAGLERFTPRPFTAVHFPSPVLYFAMLPDQAGGIWMGSVSNAYVDRWWRIEGREAVPFGDFARPVTAVYRDQDGTALVGSQTGLWRFNGSTFEAEEIPAAAKNEKLQALVRDRQGRLWASYRNHPVYARIGDKWVDKGHLASLPDQAPAIADVDEQGRIWFGYFNNLLAVVDGTHVRVFNVKDGLDIGTTTALITAPPVLVGGERGLAFFDGKSFRRITTAQPEALSGITGLLRMADGSVWINGNAGAVHIEKRDIDRAIHDSTYKTVARVFSNDDGVAGGAQQVRPLPSLVQGSDGRLWFASSTGLSWIDPTTLNVNKAPPSLYIRSVVAGDKVYSPSLPLKLPPRTRDLTINYSVLGTTSPRRQAFRYKMVGLKQPWQDVGPRREAVYTNLGPGHYEFVLQAANEDGVWNLTGTSIAFDIAPAFNESWWFKVIVAAIGLSFAWLAYVARLRYIKENIRDRLSARHAERDRIARDLHDTLIQAMQGLLLRLQVWAIDPRLDEVLRRDLDTFVNYARNMMIDGRNRILQLRRESDDSEVLENRLNAAILESSSETSAAIVLLVEGPVRDVHPDVLPDVVDIAHEAIRNAARHAGASSIQVLVTFAAKALKITVEDDGCGIDEQLLRNGGRPEHWGLRGMTERARRISSSISIRHRAERGTLIELAVPARLAYMR